MIVPTPGPSRRRAHPSQQASRQVGLIVWCALMAGFVAFAAIATWVRPTMPAVEGSPLTTIAPLFSIATLALSQVLWRTVRPEPGVPADSLALNRMIIAAATNQGGALFAVIAWMREGNPLVVFAAAISVAGLLLAFPSEARWRRLGGAGAQGGPGQKPNRLVR